MDTCKFNNKSINNDIKNYLQQNLKEHKITQYAYALLNKLNPAYQTVIHNYPEEWEKIYVKNKLHLLDPIILAAKKKVEPFSWHDNAVINIKSINNEVFALAKRFKIENGYTFVLHDGFNNMATLSLSNDDGGFSFEAIIEENKAKIQILLMRTHAKMLELYSYYSIGKGVHEVLFTNRENEILYWASIGKTYPEIAMILGITKNTVRFHMKNVVEKLGVVNAKHAIRVGIESNLIKQPA